MEVTGLETDQPGDASSLLERFGDNDQISDWAADSLVSILQSGIAGGRTGQLLEPQAYITRAEVAVMIERLLRESGLI
ncbi:hypothetical protein D3C71_2064050 [compost metagenome]